MATFVLIHGAWHGGWCYRDVARSLRADGHNVFTPSLTGLGDRAHLASPDVDLETHVTDVVSLFEAEEIENAVLCGHSYGGMVITGAAERLADRLHALVYLDAFVPESGKCLLDLTAPERRQQIEAAAAKAGSFTLPVPPGVWKIADPEKDAWVSRRVVPHPMATMRQVLEHTDPWTRVAKRVFVLAEGNEGSPFHRYAERYRDDPAWTVVGVPCHHDVMVDEPALLTEILLDASS